MKESKFNFVVGAAKTENTLSLSHATRQSPLSPPENSKRDHECLRIIRGRRQSQFHLMFQRFGRSSQPLCIFRELLSQTEYALLVRVKIFYPGPERNQPKYNSD